MQISPKFMPPAKSHHRIFAKRKPSWSAGKNGGATPMSSFRGLHAPPRRSNLSRSGGMRFGRFGTGSMRVLFVLLLKCSAITANSDSSAASSSTRIRCRSRENLCCFRRWCAAFAKTITASFSMKPRTLIRSNSLYCWRSRAPSKRPACGWKIQPD